MKILILFSFAFSIFQYKGFAQDGAVYSYQITTPEGQVFSLKDFKGKRIMLVVFPTSKAPVDSLMLTRLDSFSIQYATKVAIIGIPTFEDGFTLDSATALKNWYRKYTGNYIILSQVVNSRKSNKNQEPLFAWLTHATLNGHFDQDIGGAGQIFFINETGELYGVIAASSPITGKLLKKMLLN